MRVQISSGMRKKGLHYIGVELGSGAAHNFFSRDLV